METPKTRIKYSRVYDDRFRTNGDYPSKDEVLKFTDGLKKEWSKYENIILKEIANVSGLGWKENNIDIYIVGKTMPLSDPLTINLTPDFEVAIDLITHELIHRIWTYNELGEKSWEYFANKYKGRGNSTIVHVPVIAIQYEVLKKVFPPDRAKKGIGFVKTIKGLEEPLKIIELAGSSQLVSEFVSVNGSDKDR